MIKINSNNLVIILIIVVAFLIRLGALSFGLPNVLSFGDEIVHIAAAFNMLQEKTLRANFGFYYVPPLMSYLLAPLFGLIGFLGILFGKFQNIAAYKELVILHKEYFLIVSRLISAIFGTVSVYFIYLFSKEFFSDNDNRELQNSFFGINFLKHGYFFVKKFLVLASSRLQWFQKLTPQRNFVIQSAKSQKIALVSALFLAFDFLSVHESQIGRFWSPLAFFVIASAYFILKIYKEGDLKWYVLSGVFIGFGFGMGYLTAIMLPFFLLAHFMRKDYLPKEKKKIIIGFGFAVFLIALFIYLNFTAFNRQFGHVIFTVASFFGAHITFTEIDAPQNVRSNFFYFKETISFMWNNSPLFFISGLLGFLMILFSKKEKFLKILFIGFPFLYLFVITFLFTGVENRYILPAVPFFIIAASYFVIIFLDAFLKNKLSYLIKRESKIFNNFIMVLLVLFFVSYSFYVSVLYSLKLRKNDTRVQAVNWLYANAAPHSKIILWDEYTEINEDKESVFFLSQNNLKRMDTKRKYLFNLDEEKYPRPNFFVYPLSRIDTSKFNLYEVKADYLFFTFWDKKEEEEYKHRFQKKELIAKFYPKSEFSDIPNLLNNATANPFYNLKQLDYLGPYVEIYKILN